ncbi:diguanylate cyclase domain-containing protein [Rhizobium paknamense]|uniref:diguanylate cyclase n=1 Tax=Rhizobium paknamense TaxID=1206817 RepID=A0ABU0IF39_9HYPH|nr:diguanylate cyclase [Rhizobium paknamense]MDQ0456854.1 diguanylate cyclase (GGDEF)-like protein/PAS domain S-box-containing protein [Rhizobium paknamense]
MFSSERRLIETARAIGVHTDDVFRFAQQPLGQLVESAEKAHAGQAGYLGLIAQMHQEIQHSKFLRSIAYADQSGALIESTFRSNVSGMNLSNREYFQFHRSNSSSAPRIGLPSQSQTDGKWFLPITQRVNLPDGGFGGVMIATIDIDHFVSFMRNSDLGPDNSFVLMREDGNIILRLPIDPAAMHTNLAGSAFFRDEVLKKHQGSYEYLSPFDGMRRISGYYRSPETGITVLVAQSKRALFYDWVDYSKYPWLCLITTGLIALGMALRWLRQTKLREQSERIVAMREAELRLITRTSTDAIEKIDSAGIRQFVSPAAEKLYSQTPESLLGTSIFDAGGKSHRGIWLEALEKLSKGSESELILWERRAEGTDPLWLESAISAVSAGNVSRPEAFVVITRDVTQQELKKRELDLLAQTDGLTGLFNKRHFSEILNDLIGEDRRDSFTIILIDLDRFKQFNDTYGHLAGDHCLQAVARAIQDSVQGHEAVAARFGGEELAVVLSDCDRQDAAVISEIIRRNVQALGIEHINNHPFGQVTISLGHVTVRPRETWSAQAIVEAADQALYDAKQKGRNRSIGAGQRLERAPDRLLKAG